MLGDAGSGLSFRSFTDRDSFESLPDPEDSVNNSNTSPYHAISIEEAAKKDNMVTGTGYDSEMISNTSLNLLNGAAQLNFEPEAGVESVGELADDINFARRDWNAEYQALLETRYDTAELELERTQKLASLADEFARVATAIGTTIITERYMRPEERSVEVIEKLGVAGGEKYVHGPQRMFFKLCVDSHNLYGGDEGAAKAAGNELKGLMEYMDCRLSGLRFPLTVLIDYLGYRLMAESILPIDRTTLVYGSADGGKTIETGDEGVDKMMRLAAAKLNLATHKVWDYRKTFCHSISSCVDIEIHRGRDNRLYLVDAARAMPCMTPVQQLKGSNLYRLFRPEFVAQHGTGLCPDAYGGWPLENREEFERDIDEATNEVMNKICPMFARQLDEQFRSGIVVEYRNSKTNSDEGEERLTLSSVEELGSVAHRTGINIRLLGVVYAHATHNLTRVLLMSEIVSRTLKNVLRHRMRLVKADHAEPCHEVAIAGLNSFLVAHDPLYWGRDFKKSLLKRFTGAFSRAQAEDESFDVRFECSPSLVLKRVCQFLSLHLTVRAQMRVLRLWYPTMKISEMDHYLLAPVQQAWTQWNTVAHGDRMSVKLELGDISSLTPRVKTTHVLSFEEGTALAKHALKTDDFQRADLRYRATVMIKPADLRALHNWGITCTLHAVSLLNNRPQEEETAQGAAGDMESTASTLFRRAVAKYRTCIAINSQDWVALYLWGNTLLSWFGALVVERRLKSPSMERNHRNNSKRRMIFSPKLLREARERYESAWVAYVGEEVNEDEKEEQEIPRKTSEVRARELLYAWGNTYLLEALHCESERVGLLKNAVEKYKKALSVGEEGQRVSVHSLEYRLLYNLSVALSRLMGPNDDHYFGQTISALKLLKSKLSDCPPALLYHWASSITRHIRLCWGSLGLGRDKRQGLEAHVLSGLHKWAQTCDACLAQDETQLADTLDGWGQLLFLWSEIRFKLYGFHQSQERVSNTPKLNRKKLKQFVDAPLFAHTSSGNVLLSPSSTRSECSVSNEEYSEDVNNADDPLNTESEEDEPESSEDVDDESDENKGTARPVSEDIYIYCVDLYLYVFVITYKGRASRPSLDCLVPLGASKDYILSTHTIGALLSLASEAQSVHTRQECERVLYEIKKIGGNHKLKVDREVDMFLPQVVRECVAETIRGRGWGNQAPIKGQFGNERPQLRDHTASSTIVEQLDYNELWHGETFNT